MLNKLFRKSNQSNEISIRSYFMVEVSRAHGSKKFKQRFIVEAFRKLQNVYPHPMKVANLMKAAYRMSNNVPSSI